MIRLISIASRARQAEVFEVSSAASRSWNDMFEFKDRDGQVLWSLAIRAPVREPVRNLLLKIRRDVNTHTREAPAW